MLKVEPPASETIERPGSGVLLLLKDPAESRTLARDLKILGYAAACLSKPAQARSRVQPAPEALIIEDRATGMNPMPLVQELRRISGRDFPVIIISNLPLSDNVLQEMRAEVGVGDVLQKPFTLDALSKQLKAFAIKTPLSASASGIQSLTNYTSPQEVFYALLGRAMAAGGAMALTRERAEGAMHMFVRGKMLLAMTSTDPGDANLGRILIREGLVAPTEVLQARRALEAGRGEKRLGELLVEKTSLDRAGLGRCLEAQTRQRVESLFGWRTGATQVRSGEHPPANTTTVHLDLPPMIIGGLRTGGDPEVLGRLVQRAQRSRLSISATVLRGARRYAETQAESVFLESLGDDVDVEHAMTRSGATEEEAGVWLAYLTLIEGIKLRETRGATQPAAFALRLDRIKREAEQTEAEERKQKTDRQYALGWKLLSSGQFSEAADRFAQVIAQDPSNAAAYANFGWCKFRCSEDHTPQTIEAATRIIFKGISKDSKLGLGYVYLGRIHAALGESEHAASAYLKALEVDPGNREALDELRQLHLARGRDSIATPVDHAEPASAESEDAATTPTNFRLALVVVEWGQSASETTSASLTSPSKARMVHEVREAGASLEEFSFTRLCAVVRSEADGAACRLIAVRLGLRLLDTFKQIAQTGAQMAPAAVVAIVPASAPQGDVSLGVSEALASARPLLQHASPWQIIADARMYRGFENLVDGQIVRGLPHALEIRAGFDVIDAAAPVTGTTSLPPPGAHSFGPPQPPGSMGGTGWWSAGQQVAPPQFGMSAWGQPTPSVPIPALSYAAGQSFASHSLPPPGLSTTRTINPAQILTSGTVLGSHRIEHLIGKGGMGEVYRATDLALLRPVAVKVMRAEVLTSPLALRRFQREAQALARINTPYVTQIYGMSLESNPALLFMELVEGPSLRELLKDRGVIAVSDAVDIALQTVRGLQTVFDKGLIHRDVNPKNILLGPTGTVKITDFGMVKMELTAPSISATNNIVGTPLYISPEQAQGANVDFRTDLYGLGVTLFHLLTGRPPFTGTTVGELLTKQILEPLPSLAQYCPEAPTPLVELVHSLCAKSPTERPATHQDVSRALEGILESMGIAIGAPS